MKKISLFALLAACLSAGAHSGQAQAFIGLQTGGTAISSYSAPGAVPVNYTVTGLGTDTLADIDFFSSSTGVLYGMSNSGTLYSLAQSGATMFSATVASNVGVIPGGVAAIDFNPMANRLRVFTSTSTTNAGVTGNNYRLSVGANGTFTPDGMLAFASSDANVGVTPNLVAAAYSNNGAGTPSTALYSLDANLDALILNTVAPSFNSLTTLGTLNLGGTRIDITAGTAGFDITSINGVNIAYLTNGNTLYTVNLANGALTLVGAQMGVGITDIAFIPEPGTYAMLGVGGLGLAVFALRRRQQAAA